MNDRSAFFKLCVGSLLATTCCVLSFGYNNAALAAEPTESGLLARIFDEHGAKGTFALLDLKSDGTTVHDASRAAKRFIPASTFKIPNSLIGLETRAVATVDEVLPYGGKPQPFPQWEHDMPMREAIQLSAVPIYQEVARRVGLQRMADWVVRLDYGNREIGRVVDRFWLDGPLEISAIEQTRFLARLVRGELPCSAKNVKAVREITLIEQSGGYALHAKTGWGTSGKPEIGWWVGWVEHDGSAVATFALNIDVLDKQDVAKRIPLGRACLAELGVLPASETAK